MCLESISLDEAAQRPDYWDCVSAVKFASSTSIWVWACARSISTLGTVVRGVYSDTFPVPWVCFCLTVSLETSFICWVKVIKLRLFASASCVFVIYKLLCSAYFNAPASSPVLHWTSCRKKDSMHMLIVNFTTLTTIRLKSDCNLNSKNHGFLEPGVATNYSVATFSIYCKESQSGRKAGKMECKCIAIWKWNVGHAFM